MRPPVRIVADVSGLMCEVRDVDGVFVASCADAESARLIVNSLNDDNAHASYVDEAEARIRSLTMEVASLKRFLAAYEQTSEWHDKRKTIIRR